MQLLNKMYVAPLNFLMELFDICSMMNGDIVKKTFRLCLLLVANSVVRKL